MAVDKIETPLWDLGECADQVYEPSEDSFLLLDTLEEELNFIRNKMDELIVFAFEDKHVVIAISESLLTSQYPNMFLGISGYGLHINDHIMKHESLNPLNILEIGPGSGIIISALARIIKNSHCVAIDINSFACKTTQKTALLNNVNVDVVQSDLLCGLKLRKGIDLMVFNPPYVPSSEEEEKDIIDKAWAGDARGRSTTDRLFPVLPDLMSENSAGYIVALEENDPEEMCSILKTLGFQATIIKKRKVIGERLSVLKFIKKTT